MVDTANIQESNEPKLCRKCDGVGSIWIYNKEVTCDHCEGKGIEPSPVNSPSRKITPIP